MQPIKFENLIDLIRMHQRPYLILSFRKNIYTPPVSVGAYDCPDSKTITVPEQIEAGILWLQKNISLFPEDTIFQLIMKNAEKSNQGGVSGPFDFSVSEIKTVEPVANQNQQFSGLGAIPAGYVPQSDVKAARAEAELDFKEKLYFKEREFEKRENDLKFEQLKNEFAEKIEFASKNKLDMNVLSGIVEKALLGISMFTGKPFPGTLSGTQPIADTPETDIYTKEITNALDGLTSSQKINALKMLNLYKNKLNADTDPEPTE